MRQTHIGTALLLIPLSLFGLFWVLPNYTVPSTSPDDISPAFVPSAALIIILVYSAILLVRELRSKVLPEDEIDEEFGKEATGVDRRVLLNTLLASVVCVLTWLGIKHIGFEPVTAVLIAAIMFYVGVRSWLTIGLCAVGAPVVLSLCTYYFFSTELPGFWK